MPLPELHAISAFSFLRGSSSPEALVTRAVELGIPSLALIDRDGVSGAARFQAEASKHDEKTFRPIFGVNLAVRWPRDDDRQKKLRDKPPDGRLALLVTSRLGYQNLCALVTIAKSRVTKEEAREGYASVTPEELALHRGDLLAVLTAADPPLSRLALRRFDRDAVLQWATTIVGVFGRGDTYVELTRHDHRPEERRTQRLVDLARHLRIATVATGDVRYAVEGDARLHDVFACIRERTTVERAGKKLLPHHGWHLQPEMVQKERFDDLPEALLNAQALAARCAFTLKDLRYSLPSFTGGDVDAENRMLRELTLTGARERLKGTYDEWLPQIEKELALIKELGFPGYFLIVHDIIKFCRASDILVQGRGSAANSVVCFCLGITAIQPGTINLLFERFLSKERGDWPDIDLDLPSGDKREKAIQYVFEKYGARHAAMTANTITYRGRSAIREVGRALGMPDELLGKVARQLHHVYGASPETLTDRLRDAGLDPTDGSVRLWLELGHQMQNLPRHLGQHSGGIVIASGRLDHVVPIEPASMDDRRIVQWDKEDLEGLGILKIDLLGLGMMAVLEEVMATVKTVDGKEHGLYDLPENDPKSYAMMQAADTVGLFQIESRAQMATLPRLCPKNFYDLTIQIAIVRPGPIVGGMIHPFINRRRGREKVTYPHDELEPILKRTMGVAIFQEQLMSISMIAAGFSGGEAEELRRAMGSKRSAEKMARIEKRLREGMTAKNYKPEAQEQIVKGIKSFAEYGFPESHSASFALLAYASAFFRAHYPATYVTAMLNHWPMGFYHPAVLVRDAQRHGVRVLPIDVTHSRWECAREGVPADQWMRLGLRYVGGLREATARSIEAARAASPFTSLEDFRRRTSPERSELEALAELGALRFTDPSRPWQRREALWQVQALEAMPRGIFDRAAAPRDDTPGYPMTMPERVAADLARSGMTVGPHPMSFVRDALRTEGLLSTRDVVRAPHGTPAVVAGVVITRQRPHAAKGFFFISLEDEFGVANVIVAPPLYEAQRALLATAMAMRIYGVVERQDGVTNVKAIRAEPFTITDDDDALLPASHDFH